MVSITAKNPKNSDTVPVQCRTKLKCCSSFSLIFTDEDCGKIRTYVDVNNEALIFFTFFWHNFNGKLEINI